MVVLREILLSAVRAGDPITAWSAAAWFLRSHYLLITPAGQNGLASALSNSAERLPSGTCCADPALPFITYLPAQHSIRNTLIFYYKPRNEKIFTLLYNSGMGIARRCSLLATNNVPLPLKIMKLEYKLYKMKSPTKNRIAPSISIGNP
ncbi:hypothetical protein FNV43_RR00495 [Rhamnella rubrinervis]|uniref:Uncharacterized protein n=1 Tax=Rhamnella rubrinervis TaxID=2594499 RepID=A0A8K0HPN7_9ROSA|nr:hypothetical protein FNV43_RR00495 [Rhamnella rubrinervis]